MINVLYRGKRKYKNDWVEGLPIIGVFGDLLIQDIINHWDKQYIIDPNSIGEFTGKEDKNNKKIFEGDIVRIFDKHYPNHKSDYKVYWGDYAWSLISATGDGDDYGPFTRKFGLPNDVYEVIGNTYNRNDY